MNTEQTEQQSLHISQERILAFVRAMISGNRGREDDEHPLPHGPWDPVIRLALERIYLDGPRPHPWKSRESGLGQELLRSGTGVLEKLCLESISRKAPGNFRRHWWRGVLPVQKSRSIRNHSRLGLLFMVSIAQAVISRAELIQEIERFRQARRRQHDIIIVGGYISRFAEEFCGNGFRLKYPYPGPRPNWFTDELDGIDLLVIAVQFDQAAKETYSEDLRQNLAEASGKFTKSALARMQEA